MKSPEKNDLEHMLIKCITACETCMTKCLQEENPGKMRDCINLQRDCIDICVVTAKFMARNSPHTEHVMKECIELCRLCAEACRKHPMDHCQKCAEVCAECLHACEEYMDHASV